MAAEAALACHPDTPCPAVQALFVSVERAANALHVSYSISGKIPSLRIPAPCAARFTGGLWRHTCCEIFVARTGCPAYHEFNFSPSGEWAAYAFRGYRDGAARCEGTPGPDISLQRSETALRLNARVALPDQFAQSVISLGISAVIEDMDGTLSYWALRHSSGKPDFHHRGAFALAL